jgi:hypothetical protein
VIIVALKRAKTKTMHKAEPNQRHKPEMEMQKEKTPFWFQQTK